MKNGNKNREWEMKILIGLRFQPRPQGSLLPVPSNSRRKGEKTWEQECWFKLGFVPVFHFPVPVLVTCLKNPIPR